MGCIDRHWRAELLHERDAGHVDDQVVIAKTDPALAQDDRIGRGRLTDLVQDVLGVGRRHELRLLDVQQTAARRDRFCAGNDDIGLPRQKGRHLQEIGDHRHRLGLRRLMIIGADRHAEFSADRRQLREARFETGAPIGSYRGPIGLVKTRLEYEGQMQFGANATQMRRDGAR